MQCWHSQLKLRSLHSPVRRQVTVVSYSCKEEIFTDELGAKKQTVFLNIKFSPPV